MSTRLTKEIPMVESHSLTLIKIASALQEQATLYVCNQLYQKGYLTITPSTLNFLSALDCGINYASDIARDLGVSRQMVAKTVKELCNYGYLEQQAGPGKQKQILFTTLGTQLISDARQALANLDHTLEHSTSSFTSLLNELENTCSTLTKLNNEE